MKLCFVFFCLCISFSYYTLLIVDLGQFHYIFLSNIFRRLLNELEIESELKMNNTSKSWNINYKDKYVGETGSSC